jgi:hypothetical protein
MTFIMSGVKCTVWTAPATFPPHRLGLVAAEAVTMIHVVRPALERKQCLLRIRAYRVT